MGNNKYKRLHKAKGLCLHCSEKAMPGRLLCNKHFISGIKSDLKHYLKNRDYRIKQVKELKKEYIRDGRCSKCSAPLGEQDAGHRQCVNCRFEFHTVPYRIPNENNQKGCTC